MDATQAASLRLADQTAAEVVALWDAVEEGELSTDEFRAQAAAVIAKANARGVSLADMGLTAEMIRHAGAAVRPTGLTPTAVQVDQERIAAGLAGVIAEQPSSADTPEALNESRRSRIHSFARSEPLLTVASSIQTGMVARGAQGWVRQLDADPCKVCRGWADGVVRSPNVRMARHVGCGCIQVPVFS